MVVRELITKLGFKVDTKKISDFESSINNFKTKVAVAASNFGSFGKAVGDGIMKLDSGTIAMGAAGAAIYATGKFIASATEKYLAFEEGMKGVERVTLATAEEMKRMEEAALAAGESSIFTTADAANAMKFLAQSGLQVNEVITALPGALQLAAAAEMDLATAAEISTQVLTSNKLKVEDLTRVNDVLAKTAARTNTDVISLGWSFTEIGNIGQMAGLSLEEISAHLGILANNGVKGTSAGTTFKNAMIALLSPTKKGGELLRSLGIDMTEYTDSAGRFKEGALPKVFGELNKAYTEGRVGIGTLTNAFGKLPAKGLATFASAGREELEKLTEELKNAGGSAEQAAKISFKGLSGALEQLDSATEAAMVRFMKSSGLNKIFEDIVRFLADILPPLIDNISVILKPIGKVLRVILFPFKLIGAVLGGVIKAFAKTGDAATSVLDPLDRIADFLDGIIESVRGFFDAFNKISIFERISNWIKEISVDYRKFFEDLAKSDSFVGKLYRMFLNINRIVKSIVDLIGIQLDKEISQMQEGWQEAVKNIFSFFSMIGQEIDEYINIIAAGFEWIWQQVSPIIDLMIQPLKDAFNLISDTIEKIANLLEIEVAKAKKPEEDIQKTISKETAKIDQKNNTFNVNAPVTVNGGDAASGKSIRGAVVSAFSLELQKMVTEAGGL